MEYRRRIQLLRNSNERMRSAIDELERAVEDMRNVETAAAGAGVPTPKILRWWEFMRRESWIQVKRSLELWWQICGLKFKKGIL